MEAKLKQRATREELFESDEYAPDWKTHQRFRLHRITEIRARDLSVPAESIRLGYRDKLKLELMNKHGATVHYRPEGVILHHEQADDALGMMVFEVCWVDPWGYAHSAQRSFLDIVINPVDEISYMRLLREYRNAVAKHWLGSPSSV